MVFLVSTLKCPSTITLFEGYCTNFSEHVPPGENGLKKGSYINTYIHCGENSFQIASTMPLEGVGQCCYLTLPMLKLLSSKAQGCKGLWKTSKPCHVGIHSIALAEYSQMNTHMPGFQSFFRFANLTNTKWCKKPENDWNPGIWVLIWEFSARAIQ